MMNKRIPAIVTPFVVAFTVAVFACNLWAFRPYGGVHMMMSDWYISTRMRFLWEFSIIFGILNMASLWLLAAAVSPPRRVVSGLAGLAVLSLFLVQSLLVVPIPFITDDHIILATLGVTGYAVIMFIVGLVKRQWKIPALSAGLMLLFCVAGYWYLFSMIAVLFGD